MAVRFTGAWGRIRGRLSQAGDWITGPAEKELMTFGLAVNTAIRKNMLNHPPPGNAAATVAKKGFDGTWVDSGWLANAAMATPKVYPKGVGRVSVVMVVDEVTHPSGIPASVLFSWLEYGTKYIPPRPVLTPVVAAISSGAFPAMSEFQARFKDKLQVGL